MKRIWTPEKIKTLRACYEMSQAKFAEFLTIPVDTLQNWEQGRAPVPPIGEWAFDRLREDLKRTTIEV